ncbi:hypothetical protein EOPP23_09460 [Endozoicomonas sp. OPT23]|uniref:S41 family peptidase n=1 Tax=Endozoicomonas sp. OPT23 TaxID=2072845 RepID=UPI00129BF1B6|nr:S41 family peptidase [Endozoicomonas sp. OPT23]MRI33210.1 hypothetical protein [Endozoicomonas sp. OPT23]
MKLALYLFLSTLSSFIFASEGFYRFPDLHNDTVVFTAEGDLWKVSVKGGEASRLTSDYGFESHAHISPDGSTIAFIGNYDGPRELYTLPVTGGTPKRLTFSNSLSRVRGWTQDNQIILATNRHSSFWESLQLVLVDAESGYQTRIPLAQASDGSFSDNGDLYFTRFTGSNDNIRNYQGGTAENLWRYSENKEAIPLTHGYPGTSKSPMVWRERVYFISDRSGRMNIWSMDFEGKALKQHTFFKDKDIQTPSLNQGRIIFHANADLFIYETKTNATRKLDITLPSDLDQKRQRWVEFPARFLRDFSLSPDNQELMLTARGQVVINPLIHGRTITLPRPSKDLFFETAQFVPALESVLASSSQRGKLAFWLLPPNGEARYQKILETDRALYSGPYPSPDGSRFAWFNSDYQLKITDLPSGDTRTVDQGSFNWPSDFVNWSPDSNWLIYTKKASNLNTQLYLYNISEGAPEAITTDRHHSFSPAWSTDGDWIYFLSNRHYSSRVEDPYGLNQPEPYSEQNTGIYMLAVNENHEWPFREPNELSGQNTPAVVDGEEQSESFMQVDRKGLAKRLYQVPVTPGDYRRLKLAGDYLYWQSNESSGAMLKAMPITHDGPKPYTVAENISSYRVSSDEQNVLISDTQGFSIKPTGADISVQVELLELKNWRLHIDPTAEWQEILYQTWSLYKNYFADTTMDQNVWQQELDNQLKLLPRITDRRELDQLLANMLGSLGVLHVYTYPGDQRTGLNWSFEGSLGAEFEKTKHGFLVKHIHKTDYETPSLASPLARPYSRIQEGDTITHINQQPLNQDIDLQQKLTFQHDTQTLLTIESSTNKSTWQEIVTPLSIEETNALRYQEWLLQRRQTVDEKGEGKIGYVHLPNMEKDSFADWVKQYYPVFNRDGLILDIRHNTGGNISSWILNRLIRKAFVYASARGKNESWNMQYAFRGHIVLLVNEHTASDAEELADGFRSLELGTIIGTRTWGGRIFSTEEAFTDNGAVSLPFFGHYFDSNRWSPENWGVEPDIRIDNLPYATFHGEDTQLDAALRHLQRKIADEPIIQPLPPRQPIAVPVNQ